MCKIFEGHRSVLSPYYRHLFLMVKSIATSQYFGEEEKQSFLKILRAQMTCEEQILLYYNWLSGYGYEWEEKKRNRFFTKYKMIHNIEPVDLSFLGIDVLKQFPWIRSSEANDLFEYKHRTQKFKS